MQQIAEDVLDAYSIGVSIDYGAMVLFGDVFSLKNDFAMILIKTVLLKGENRVMYLPIPLFIVEAVDRLKIECVIPNLN